jgi:hypothetical protein
MPVLLLEDLKHGVETFSNTHSGAVGLVGTATWKHMI